MINLMVLEFHLIDTPVRENINPIKVSKERKYIPNQNLHLTFSGFETQTKLKEFR